MTQATSAEQQFLMGGESVPSVFDKHDPVGTRKGGTITEQPVLRQQSDFDTGELLYWDNGDKRMHLVVTVQTEQRDPSNSDDDGRRRFYIKGNLQKAVREAVQRSGAAGLEVGGSLFVTRTGRDEPKKRGMDGAWLHAAEYTAAAANYLANNGNGGAEQRPSQPEPTPAPAGGGLDAAQFPHLSPEQFAGVKAAGLSAEQVRQMFPAPTGS